MTKPSQLRYWDGQAWTTQVMPAAPPVGSPQSTRPPDGSAPRAETSPWVIVAAVAAAIVACAILLAAKLGWIVLIGIVVLIAWRIHRQTQRLGGRTWPWIVVPLGIDAALATVFGLTGGFSNMVMFITFGPIVALLVSMGWRYAAPRGSEPAE
jgi:hypothetical protein